MVISWVIQRSQLRVYKYLFKSNSMPNDPLEPIPPDRASKLYRDHRLEDASFDTRSTIDEGLDIFVEWCNHINLTNMNNVRGRQLMQFKSYLKESTNRNTMSLNGVLCVLRRFLVYCVQIEAVERGVPDKVPISNVPDEEQVNYDKPSDKQVNESVAYLDKYEYASRRHVQFTLLKEVGFRVGEIRAIDLEDIDLDKKYIQMRHRPERDRPDVKGTPLKNGTDGEREVNISTDVAGLIHAYLTNPERYDVTDKFGREPLLTTDEGRVTISTIRRDLYKLTRPCVHADRCPHDRDIDTCDATINENASACPSSHSPHPLRRWSIEFQIDAGVPKEELVDRVDVSLSVLNKHYDTRSEKRKRKHRLETLSKVLPGYGDDSDTLDQIPDAIFDEDGLIDVEALMQLLPDDEISGDNTATVDVENHEDENQPINDEPSAETEAETKIVDEDQRNLSEFGMGSSGFSDPGSILVAITTALGISTTNRLHSELADLSHGDNGIPSPSRERAVKGFAAYTVYVMLVAINLALLGLVSA